MPAMLDDPMSPTIYRTSGVAPYPRSNDPLPLDIVARHVTLRDRVTIATILPFSSTARIPSSLLAYLCDQLNQEIELGDTYPMVDPLSYEKFQSYWFQNFGAVMLLGNVEHIEDVVENWASICLGSFYIKPNYPGRSSHVCNAGFLVTDAARNRGVGRLLGEAYLDWAPKLSYTYSVFNLVYETNVASCRIWDSLGFKRIGRVKGCGNLKSYPDQLVDAIIFGRDLGPEEEDLVSEERFDKIKFYLKFGKYPNGADRAEKSRLRSAATHYKLLDGDKLMLKDKEVISDPKLQYEIARKVHVAQHGGINKTTATIAESYHWIRIKETVSLVIRNCDVCKEMGKVPVVRADGVTAKRATGPIHGQGGVSAAGRLIDMPLSDPDSHTQTEQYGDPFDPTSASTLGHPTISPHPLGRPREQSLQLQAHHHLQRHHQQHQHHTVTTAQMHPHQNQNQHQHQHTSASTDDYIALDPQIMEDVRNHLGNYIDPDVHSSYTNPFQSMLSASDESQGVGVGVGVRPLNHSQGQGNGEDGMGDVHNADLDMLIEDDEEEHVRSGDGDVHVHMEGDVDGEGESEDGGAVDPRVREQEVVEGRVQAQMAARAAEAAMRGRFNGKGERGGNSYDGGHRYRVA